MNQNIQRNPQHTRYVVDAGTYQYQAELKKHSVFNKLVVSLKITVHDQFGVLAPQFLTEGTSGNYISLN